MTRFETNGQAFETCNYRSRALGLARLGRPGRAGEVKPAAMPITVLDNRDAAAIQPAAPAAVMPGQDIPRPQPLVVSETPPFVEEPAPSIAPPTMSTWSPGAIALPNPQVPQAAEWSALDLAGLARWADVQELSGRQ